MKNCKRLGIVVHGDFIIGLRGDIHETIRRTIDFAEQLDCETIQVSIAHSYAGTEFDEYRKKNRYFTHDEMTDELGHQSHAIEYAGLSREEIVEAVEYIYGRYYFRPKIIFRIVCRAIFNSAERRRLYREARAYLKLRAKRKQRVRAQACA